MKTLHTPFVLSILFSILMLTGFAPNAQADCLTKDCALAEKAALNSDTATSVPEGDEEFDLDFSDPFFFSDKVIINVYGKEDALLYSGSFTKEEMQTNEELKGWLKKSEFLLSIDNQHYYFSKK